MIFVIEIPHQRPPVAWSAADRTKFISSVAGDNATTGYDAKEIRNAEDFESNYSFSDLYYREIKDAAAKIGWPLLVLTDDNSGDYPEIVKYSEQAEFDFWCEILVHDLSEGWVFENVEDAEDWCATYEGHRAVKATAALQEEIDFWHEGD